MYKSDARCGQCAYYVQRPPEIAAMCLLDGVCLRIGRATDSKRPANIGGCGSSCIIGRGSVANGFRERAQ